MTGTIYLLAGRAVQYEASLILRTSEKYVTMFYQIVNRRPLAESCYE